MKLVPYEGEVVISQKDSTFAKDENGYKLSTQEDLKDKVGNDWWHGPASLITAGVVGYGTKAAYDWLKSKETPPPPRIEPTLNGGPPNTPPPPPPDKSVPKGWEQILAKSQENAASKAAAVAAKANPVPVGYSSGIPDVVSPMNQLTGQTTTPAPVNAAPADLAPKLGGQIGQFNPANIGQPLQDPLAGRGYQTPVQDIGPRQPVPPSMSETVATGGNVTKAVNQTIANLVDKKPMGMRENYKSNKAEPIGPGAFNHLANNVGAEKAAEIWKDVYGEKNVPYKQYMEKYSQEAGKNMYGPVVPLPEGAKPGGSFGTPKYIPEFIKGGASIGGMAGAAVIPALVAAGVQAYKGNKEAVNAELKDAWNSMKSLVTMPVDVAKSAGKGDFGPFKDMLMSMNPGTLLMNEMNKRDEAALQGMIQAEKVGGGRGIAPPSAYKR